ncbi:MAG: protease HtpX [Candidatus Aenigmatarchaeota archaeon]|nr:MAG: protease HtpX [Candidatus Aenigmarchaeota archaeon]
MLNTILLLGTLTGILLAVGWFLGGFFGMFFALIFSFIINMFSYWYSDRIVLSMYKAKPLEDEKIRNIVKKLAREAKIPEPKLYLVPSETPNAFATGRNPGHSAIAITKGLLNKLEEKEIEGVLSHEIGHIKNRDMLVSTVAATVAGAVSYLAQIGYFSLFFSDSEREGNLLGLVFIIVFAPLAAFLIRLAISRSREFKADRTGALICKNPEALASALRKISGFVKEHPMRGSAATSHLWIVNPFKEDWFVNLFSTHPPVEERIRRLLDMEGKD